MINPKFVHGDNRLYQIISKDFDAKLIPAVIIDDIVPKVSFDSIKKGSFTIRNALFNCHNSVI